MIRALWLVVVLGPTSFQDLMVEMVGEESSLLISMNSIKSTSATG